MKRVFVFLPFILFCLLPRHLSAQESAAETPLETSVEKIAEMENEIAEEVAEPKSFTRRLCLALAIIAAQIFLIWLVWHLFSRFSKKIASGETKIKPLTIKKLNILSARQIITVIQFLLRIVKYIVSIFQLFITVPIVFSLFPKTKHVASIIFGYILAPVKLVGAGIIKYIPNLFTIVIIILIVRYVQRGLKFFSTQISKSKLVIPGFYADWANPTYKILQALLWAFTLAIVYPYLPGSQSRIFQSISVFVGVIVSFGSTSAIGNLVAGLVITYMRPFKTGDRVRIKDTIGFVAEKNLMVVRLKTHKNEYVSFPNLMILQSEIINYATSSDDGEEGLILNTEVTFGYSTPWQTVHKILIEAALETEYVLKKPQPFVLQTALEDFYARYQINCYTKHVDNVPAIYARLYENIQNGFKNAGLDPTAAHYYISNTSK